MAIVEMSKLSVIGLNDNKSDVLRELMTLGVCEISSQDEKLSDSEWTALIKRDFDQNSGLNADIKISEVSSALEVLDKYFTGKKPFIRCRKPVSEAEFETKNSKPEEAEKFAALVNEKYKKVLSLKAQQTALLTEISELKPWLDYEFNLDMKETKYSAIMHGTFPTSVVMADIESRLSQEGSGCVIEVVSKDDKITYAVAVCLKEDKEGVLNILRQENFNPVSFTDIVGTAKENTESCNIRLKDVESELSDIEKEIGHLSENIETLEFYYDDLVIERDRCKILSNILRTERLFILTAG